MLKKVTFAVSAALLSAGMSTSVQALPADATVANGLLDFTMHMSGASAQDKGIRVLFGSLCRSYVAGDAEVVAGTRAVGDSTLDMYRNSGTTKLNSPGKAQSVYSCILDAAQVPANIADARVEFRKQSAGGSGMGVNTIVDQNINANSKPNQYMPVNSTDCSVVNATPGIGYAEYDCTSTFVDNLAVVGVSDVNPELFANFSPTNAANVGLVSKSAAALVFGVPVTDSLYQALQAAQIAEGEISATCAIGDYTDACMPTMGKELVASIMAGKVTNWSQVKVTPAATGVTTDLFSFAAGTAYAADQTPVTVCRRVPTSGTQTQNQVKFLHSPCTVNGLLPAVTGSQTGPVIAQNSGSGNMTECLQDFEYRTNQTGHNGSIEADGSLSPAFPPSETGIPTRVGPATKLWAIGIQSTEKKDASFKFVKIDGLAPTLENAASGKYWHWVEITYQWATNATTAQVPTAQQQSLIDTIVANGGSPATLAGLNAKFIHPFGQAGYMAVSRNGHSVTDGSGNIDLINNPVTAYSHTSAGGNIDNCMVPVLDPAAPAFMN